METDKKQFALLNILKRLPTSLVYYGSALGAIALVGGANIPPELAVLAGGIGVNILSGMIDRIANGEDMSDEEIRRKTQEAIERSDLENLLTKQDFIAGYARLIRRLDILRTAIQEGEIEIVRILTEQFARHHEILIELSGYTLTIMTEQANSARRDETIIKLLEELLSKRPSVPSMKPKLFISYGRSDDENFVKRLYEDLTAHGFDIWWDRVSMPSRALTFLDEIKSAIEGRERLLLVIGTGALNSEYVRSEWQYALSRCKVVNPILRLAEYAQLPSELSLLDTRDFREDIDYDKQLLQLIKQLEEEVLPPGAIIGVPEIPQQLVPRPDELTILKQYLLEHTRRPETLKASRLGLRGMGGVGKSAIASVLAYDCEIRRAFPDGVFWLPIGQEPTLTTWQAQLGQALGDDPQSYTGDVASGKMRLSRILSNRAVLIILDDVWKSEHVKAFDMLGQRCGLLFTTRNANIALSLGYSDYKLDVLTPEQAVELLQKWTERYDPAFPEIAERLGRLPLALKLAGAKLRGGTTGQSWLKNFQRVSQIKLTRQSVDPQENLEVCFGLSVEQLKYEDQQLYFLLGVYRDHARIPQRVIRMLWQHIDTELDISDCEDIILDCERLGLADRIPGKEEIYLHDLLHNYTRDKLGERAEMAHSNLLDAFNPDGKSWYLLSNDEYLLENLAYHLAAAKRHVELHDLLTKTPDWMNIKFSKFGGDSAFADDLQVATASITEAGTSASQLLALTQLFTTRHIIDQRVERYNDDDLRTLIYLGRDSEALNQVRLRSTTIRRIAGLLAIYEAFQDRSITRTDLLREAQEVVSKFHFRNYNEWDTIAVARLAYFLARAGFQQEASSVFEKSIKAALEIGVPAAPNEMRQSILNSDRDRALQHISELLAEAHFFERSKELLEKIEDTWEQSETLSSLGTQLILEKKIEEGTEALNRALHNAYQQPDKGYWWRQTYALEAVGKALAKSFYHKNARQVADSLYQPSWEYVAIVGELAQEVHEHISVDDARILFDDAERALISTKEDREYFSGRNVNVVIDFGGKLWKAGYGERARKIYIRAKEWIDQIKWDEERAWHLGELATQMAKDGLLPEAEQIFTEAIALKAAAKEEQWDISHTISLLVSLMSKQGDVIEARQLLDAISEDYPKTEALFDLVSAEILTKKASEIDFERTLAELEEYANNAEDWEQSEGLMNVARIYFDYGLIEDAERLLEEAYELAVEVDETHSWPNSMGDLVATYGHFGRFAEAEELAYSIETNEYGQRTGALCSLADAFIIKGMLDKALPIINDIPSTSRKATMLYKALESMPRKQKFDVQTSQILDELRNLVADAPKSSHEEMLLKGLLAKGLTIIGETNDADNVFSEMMVDADLFHTNRPHGSMNTLAIDLAHSKRFAEAFSTMRAMPSSLYLNHLIEMSPSFDRVEAGLGAKIIHEALRIIGWVRIEWHEIAAILYTQHK